MTFFMLCTLSIRLYAYEECPVNNFQGRSVQKYSWLAGEFIGSGAGLIAMAGVTSYFVDKYSDPDQYMASGLIIVFSAPLGAAAAEYGILKLKTHDPSFESTAVGAYSGFFRIVGFGNIAGFEI